MKIRIGVLHSAHEHELDLSLSASELSAKVAQATKSGDLLELTDDKGNTLIIPGSHIAFVRVVSGDKPRVGFLG